MQPEEPCATKSQPKEAINITLSLGCIYSKEENEWILRVFVLKVQVGEENVGNVLPYLCPFILKHLSLQTWSS